MSHTVWKYCVSWGDEIHLDLPTGAVILDAQPQGLFGGISLWALVDPDAPLATRQFRLAGTGHPITGAVRHISTFQVQDGALVFHLFEIRAPSPD